MKRILSLILTLCIIGTCFSFTSVVSAADEKAATPLEIKAFEFLSALEIMVGDEEGNANLDKNMSRAEFAQLLTNILKYAGKTAGEEDLGSFFDETIWQENFFGEDANFDELLYPSEEEKVIPGFVAEFEDVSTAHWAYDAVNFVREIGIMNGTSATTFEPDGQVRTNEVIKCLMVMLGYKSIAEVNGGYPTGYLKFAQRLNLTYGAPAGEFCTRGAIAIILKNAMDANVLIETSYNEHGEIDFAYDSNRTLASEILGLQKVKGIMTDNGYTSIIGESSYDGEKIVVNNNLFRVPEGKEFASFIGRDIDLWYTNYKSNDPGVAVYAELGDRDEAIVIDAETVTGVLNGTINYKVNKAARKASYDGAYVIRNGKAESSYDETIFDIEYGTITVIETRHNSYKKIVVIDEFETWFVGNVDPDNKIIYNALRDGEYVDAENDIIALDFEDPQYVISIYNADGTKADFDAIKKDSVLDVARNGKAFKIYVTNSAITDFKIDEILVEGGKTFLSNGDNQYEVTTAFMNYANREEFRLNDIMTIYLNSNNKIAWAVNSSKSGLKVGYILRMDPSNNSPVNKQFGVSVYTDAGAHTYFDLADTVRVSDNSGVLSKKTEKEFYDAYAANFNAETNIYDGIFRYTLNDNDEINYVELPILDSNTKINGKLHRILYADTTTDRNGYYGTNSFNAKVLTSTTTTKVIRVNPDFRRVDDEKAFSVGTTSGMATSDIDSSSSGNIYRAYTDVEGSAFAKYLVLKSASKASGLDTYSAIPNVYVVTKIGGGRFPDDTLGTVITGRRIKNGSSAEEVLYIKSDAVVDTEAQTATRATEHNGYINEAFPGGVAGIELGDIIRVGKDTEGLVDKIRVVWDENGLDLSADPTQTPGASPFMSRYWEAASSAPKYNCVPFGYHGDPSLSMQFYPGNYFRTGSFRVLAGFPVKVRDGGVRITTWDVVADGFEEPIDSRYSDETWAVSRVYVVNFKDGEVTVKSGGASDIRSYEDFGTNCSRIINVSRYGTVSCMIVYNSYSEN